MLSAVTFFLPYGLLVAELGSTFPQEGGIYAWCKLAVGRLYGAFAATLYWITVPLLIGGSTAVIMIAALKIFWFGSTAYLFGGHLVIDVLVELALAILFIWGITFGAIISLRRGKWISTVGFFVKLALLSIFLVLLGIFAVSGSGKGTHLAVADLVPANWGLIASSILPIVVVLWLGAEMQNSAAEEMANAQRDVPRAILRAGIIVVILYSLFLLAILIALPANQLTAVGSFLDAFRTVNHVLPAPLTTGLGWLLAPGFAASLFASAVTILIAVTILSGIVATVTVIASILLSAFGSGTIEALFVQVLSVAISTALLAYLLMFPAFLILRYKYPALPRRYRVPGGIVGAGIVTLFPMLYSGIACYFLLIPSDIYLQNNHLDRLTFELTHFVPLACIVLLTIVLYFWGRKEEQNKDVLVDLGQ
jgi:glutamate:GABA antiporter